MQDGIFFADVLARHSFPGAIVNIEQICGDLNLEVVRIGEGFRRLNRAWERAGVHGVEFVCGKVGGDFLCLQDAYLVEWDIGPPAIAFCFVPLCLAVTDEDKASTYVSPFGYLILGPGFSRWERIENRQTGKSM